MPDHNRDPLRPELALELSGEAATCALGARLAEALAEQATTSSTERRTRPGLRIYLHGELGAGKTTLVQGLIAALGYTGRVKSPTYTLVELYAFSRLNLYHFDFYRFRDENEWREAGFSEYFDSDGVCLVEWPEKAGNTLPQADLDITLELDGAEGTTRRATIAAHTLAGAQCFDSLTHFSSHEKRS